MITYEYFKENSYLSIEANGIAEIDFDEPTWCMPNTWHSTIRFGEREYYELAEQCIKREDLIDFIKHLAYADYMKYRVEYHHKSSVVTSKDALQSKFADLKNYISLNCPESRERSIVLTKLEEAAMWADKSVSSSK